MHMLQGSCSPGSIHHEYCRGAHDSIKTVVRPGAEVLPICNLKPAAITNFRFTSHGCILSHNPRCGCLRGDLHLAMDQYLAPSSKRSWIQSRANRFDCQRHELNLAAKFQVEPEVEVVMFPKAGKAFLIRPCCCSYSIARCCGAVIVNQSREGSWARHRQTPMSRSADTGRSSC